MAPFDARIQKYQLRADDPEENQGFSSDIQANSM